jgi:hypothetical protein
MKQNSGYTMIAGHPVFIPNSVMDGDGFYVSYNDHDETVYGSDTTALVLGQMQKFYVLNGDHRLAYLPLIEKGLDACIDYFKANIADINKHSEKVEDAPFRFESET